MSEELAGYNAQKVEWSEIAQAADILFHVWHDGTEMDWAKRAWATLGAAGLTEYHDALRLTRVKVRLLALAMIYRDFCQIGRDESYDGSAFVWEEGAELNFSIFRLGQLTGAADEAGPIDAEDSELAESALLALTDEERPIICRALLAAHGGVSQLAESLFATSGQLEECDSEDEEEDVPRDLFDESPNDASRVVDWIANGMRRL